MWARIDDQVPDSRKFRKIHPSAAWLWVCGICYCNKYLTDGFIPADEAETLSQNMSAMEARKYGAQLVKAKLWDEAEGGFRVHDYLDIYESASEVRAGRNATKLAKELYGNQGLVVAVRERDREKCRYCGVTVNWKDKRGIIGGVFIYVDRSKGNTISNIVVGCRACNTKVEDGQILSLQPPPPDRREPIERKIQNQVGINSDSVPPEIGIRSELGRNQPDFPIGLPTYPIRSNPIQSDPIQTDPTQSDPSGNTRVKNALSPSTCDQFRLDTAFEQLRDAYPQARRQDSLLIRQEFIRKFAGRENGQREALFAEMLAGLEQHKRSEQWRTPKHIPMFGKWIEETRWIQQLPETEGTSAANTDLAREHFQKIQERRKDGAR